jgi:alkylation response protein AidB-like acyl-CoA dehydrogenase
MASTFTGDLRDVRFVLFELLKVEGLKQYDMFKDFGKEDYETFVTEAYRFAQTVIGPVNEDGDKIGAQFNDGVVTVPPSFVEAYKKYSEAGWVGAIQAPEIGGQGLPWTIGQMIHEYFIGASVSFSLTVGLTEGVISLLHDFGTPEVNALFAPPLLDGRSTGTMCLTEAGAGSDVGANKATAKKLPNGRYLIEGTKVFITGGDQNQSKNVIHAVLARTPDAPAGTKGLGLFIVPKFLVGADGNAGEFNDVKVGRIEHKMGIKGSPTCVLNFGENGKCEGWLLGGEQDGMKIMFHMMNEARIMVGVQGLSLAAASYQAALAYSNERTQGTDITNMKDPKAPKVAIVKHPDVRRMLLWQKSVVEALRAICYSVAYYADVARACKATDAALAEKYNSFVELLTPVCKAYGSDMGTKSCDFAVQTLGGYGYCSEYPAEQYLRDARIAGIYEGTNGIQALDLIGRKMGMKGGGVFRDYLKEIIGLASKYAAHPTLGKYAKKLQEGANLLGQLMMKIGGIAMAGDIAYPALYATAFLEAMGHVCGAFYLLQEGVLADAALSKLYAENKAASPADKKKLHADNPEAKFYWGKLQSIAFFYNTILPQVKALAETITSGDRSALEVEF